MSKEVKTETFSEMWRETEAELLSEDSVGDTDDVSTRFSTDGVSQSDSNNGNKPSVLGALVPDSQPDDGTDSVDIPGVGLVSKDEIKASYMKDKDYRQKTEDLARQREALKDAEMLWEALQKDPVETVKRLARDIQSGNMQPTQAPSTGQDSSNIDDIVARKVAEALESNEGIKDARQTRVMAAINSVFEGIETAENVKLNQGDRTLILDKATQLGTTDLAFVFNGLYAQANKMSGQRENLKATSTTGNGRGETIESAPAKPTGRLSFAEAAAESLKEMGLDLTKV